MNIKWFVALFILYSVLTLSPFSVNAQDGNCRPCSNGAPTAYAGGTVYAYFVYPCDTALCSQHPAGQRQAVITTYETMLGFYSTCCCTPCGLDPFRRCPVEE
jgi:hypothetical protein